MVETAKIETDVIHKISLVSFVFGLAVIIDNLLDPHDLLKDISHGGIENGLIGHFPNVRSIVWIANISSNLIDSDFFGVHFGLPEDYHNILWIVEK